MATDTDTDVDVGLDGGGGGTMDEGGPKAPFKDSHTEPRICVFMWHLQVAAATTPSGLRPRQLLHLLHQCPAIVSAYIVGLFLEPSTEDWQLSVQLFIFPCASYLWILVGSLSF